MGAALTKVGKRIRQIRAKGISQEKLGEMCGFSFSYIGGIERAENNVSINNLEKISIALNVDLLEFFIDYEDHINLDNKLIELNEISSILSSFTDEQLKRIKIVIEQFGKS